MARHGLRARGPGAAPPGSDLERARGAFGERAWEDAYRGFERAGARTPLSGDDLERMARAAGLTAREAEYLSLFERAYHAHLDSGAPLAAARAAFWIGFRLLGEEPGKATGWLARAERLVEAHGADCVERGYLTLVEGRRALAAGDGARALACAAAVAEIGERFGEPDLSAFARQLQGAVLLKSGDFGRGLAHLDEAMVAVVAGELSPIVTGIIYCSVLNCCQQIYALDRAREWTEALAAWCATQPQLVLFAGACVAHRAEILQWHGDWRGALDEARRAVSPATERPDSLATAAGHYQEAEIHRLRGRFAEAEEAYRLASRAGAEPQPGLALLALAQGRADAAAAQIRTVLAAAKDPMRRTRFLPAAVEIFLAAGALDEARRAADELAAVAESVSGGVLEAMAAHARGAVALAEGDPGEALAPLRRAFEVWRESGAPYLAARLRVTIAHACRALGDADGAKLELEAARAVFEELGAAPDLARLDAAGKGERSDRPHGLTPRELEVLRHVAAGKTNKSIAAELFLSEKTVDRHVSNIFDKLGVPSRAAATAFAYEHRLL